MDHTHKEFIAINSGDRDNQIFPSSNNYKVDLLNIGFDPRNIASISLHSAIIPDIPCITSQPYILLYINELGGRTFKGTNSALDRAFAFIQIDRAIGSGWINAKPDFTRGIVLQHKDFSYEKFNSLTITLTNPEGQKLPLPNEADAINDKYQHTLLFEVVKRNVSP